MKCPCCGAPVETTSVPNATGETPLDAYCPECRKDLWKLRESLRIQTALNELAAQMEEFEPAAALVPEHKD